MAEASVRSRARPAVGILMGWRLLRSTEKLHTTVTPAACQERRRLALGFCIYGAIGVGFSSWAGLHFFKREKEKKGASQEREIWAFGQYERGGSLPFSFLFNSKHFQIILNPFEFGSKPLTTINPMH
jgi:hypothetical protein